MAEYSYQIADGWDNEAGFTNVEALTPSAGNTIPNHDAYFVVKAYNTYSRGVRHFDVSAGSGFSGLKTVRWLLPDVDCLAYEWFRENYEGQVTIATTLGESTNYANWNAWAEFPDPAELTESDVGRFENVEIMMKLWETT